MNLGFCMPADPLAACKKRKPLILVLSNSIDDDAAESGNPTMS
jgi:hypothetical protein